MNNRMPGRRHLTRVSVLTLALLGTAILGKADILPNGIFTITYGDWGDTVKNPITFTITTESPEQMSLEGFANGVCLAGCIFAAGAPDPFMDISDGGDAPPFPQPGGTITIPPDTQSYQNTNTFDIQTLDFTTPFLASYNTEIFTCDGNEFAGCGFQLSPDGQTLDIRFTGPMVVPEPGSWVLLLTVAAGIALKRVVPFSKRS
jgi:hypothetical protein